MIATLIMHDEGPALRLPLRALDEYGIHAGQRVRIDIRPLAWPTAAPTPLLEPDGTPA